MLDFFEVAAVTVEEGKGFGTAFDRPRFPPAGSIREQIRRHAAKELFEEFLTLPLGTGLEQGFATAAGGGQGASKAQSV